MLVAAWMAMRQTDLKRILAYSTVSVLGILVVLLGLGTELAIKAAVVFLAAHALYKAALFMIAGILDHETGTRDVGLLSGLGRVMPFTAVAGLLAALSKAGAPPMFGFVGKELLYKAKLDLEALGEVVVVLAVITNVVLVATALLVGVKPFFGERSRTPREAHEAPPSLLVGPWVLGCLGIFVGLVPSVFDRVVGSPMASAIVGSPVEMKLALWHGVSPSALAVLGLSALTLVAGTGLYLRLRRRRASVPPGGDRLARRGPDALFERVMDSLPGVAGQLTRRLHEGPLRRDLTITVATAAIVIAGPLLSWRGLSWPGFGQPTAMEIVALILVLAGAGFAAASRDALTAVIGLGATGLGVTLVFLSWGAPDLAITQLMVETLTVVLLLVVLSRLPLRTWVGLGGVRRGDAVVAAALGVAVSLTVLAAGAVERWPGIAEFFVEASVPQANGRNIVNVILVDFRALDTLGETLVLALAGVGVFALLRARIGTSPFRNGGRS
jgi:multicomponent Na+:H+ antiporter subunit A